MLERVERNAAHNPGCIIAEAPRRITVRGLVQRDSQKNRNDPSRRRVESRAHIPAHGCLPWNGFVFSRLISTYSIAMSPPRFGSRLEFGPLP